MKHVKKSNLLFFILWHCINFFWSKNKYFTHNKNEYTKYNIYNSKQNFKKLNILIYVVFFSSQGNLLPFSKYIVKLVLRLIPVTEDEKEETSDVKYIDDRMIQTPGIAVGNAFLEIKEMANYAVDSVKYATEGILNYSEEEIDKTFAMEKKVNQIQRRLLDFLVKLSKEPLSEDERNKVTNLIYAVNDIERISDHGENIAELGKNLIKEKLTFSEHAQD